MRVIVVFLLGLCALSGCRSGQAVAKPADKDTEISQADSIKYEEVKEAFLNRDFVFKISREGDDNVNATDHFIVVHKGRGSYQYFSSVNSSLASPRDYVAPTPKLIEGELTDIKTSNKSREYYQLSFRLKVHFPQSGAHINIRLYKNSDQAYGLIGATPVEGWIEPYDKATIARGSKSIQSLP